MGGCSCSQLAVARTLTTRADFLGLAACCRRFNPLRTGRITVAVPELDAQRQTLLEDRINRFWQACGCGESAIATVALIALWLASPEPLDTWLGSVGFWMAALAFLTSFAVVVTIVKMGAISIAHLRLARLLEQTAYSF